MCSELGLIDELECAAPAFLSEVELIVGRQELDEANPCVEIVGGGAGPSIEDRDCGLMIPA